MEPLTYQQIVTAAIALVAIVISVVSLRRTSKVQEQQLRLQRKQEELTDLARTLTRDKRRSGDPTAREMNLPLATYTGVISRPSPQRAHREAGRHRPDLAATRAEPRFPSPEANCATKADMVELDAAAARLSAR